MHIRGRQRPTRPARRSSTICSLPIISRATNGAPRPRQKRRNKPLFRGDLRICATGRRGASIGLDPGRSGTISPILGFFISVSLNCSDYLSTVDLVTEIPIFANSPTIRGEPHIGFIEDMVRINSLTSCAIGGRPGSPDRDNLRQ